MGLQAFIISHAPQLLAEPSEGTARPVDDATEGSTQVAPMCASCVLPKKVAFVV